MHENQGGNQRELICWGSTGVCILAGGTDWQRGGEHGGKEQQRCLEDHKHEPGKD